MGREDGSTWLLGSGWQALQKGPLPTGDGDGEGLRGAMAETCMCGAGCCYVNTGQPGLWVVHQAVVEEEEGKR